MCEWDRAGAQREREREREREPIASDPRASTSPANPEARIARLRLRTLRLHRFRTPSTSPRWHRDGTDRTEIAIEKWLGFDEFDRIWWIFFYWVLFLCLSEKWYYIFVWKLRKCDEQEENVFSILFSATQPNTRKYFSKYFLECNQTLENIFLS